MERFFYLSLSSTVGGAVYEASELVQGKEYRCGEVGHMTIVPGRSCLLLREKGMSGRILFLCEAFQNGGREPCAVF